MSDGVTDRALKWRCDAQADRNCQERDAVIGQLQLDLHQRTVELEQERERLEACRSQYTHQVLIEIILNFSLPRPESVIP